MAQAWYGVQYPFIAQIKILLLIKFCKIPFVQFFLKFPPFSFILSGRQLIISWKEVVVAQLVEWLLSILDVRGLTPVNGKIYIEHFFF